MKDYEDQVRNFMLAACQHVPDKPTAPTTEIAELRGFLCREEAINELDDALEKGDLTEIYDAILDSLYVIIGTAVACGLRIEPGWQEVHRSNMTKFIDGYLASNGKWIKGPSFSPPNLDPILKQQYEKNQKDS